MSVYQLKHYKSVHRRPAKCGMSSSLFTNFKRRLSISVPIYGKSHCCLMNSILSASLTLKILTTACFTQFSSNLTELLVSGMALVAYRINGKQYDLNSWTDTTLIWSYVIDDLGWLLNLLAMFMWKMLYEM